MSIDTPVVPLSTTPGTSSYTTPDSVLTSWRYHSGPVPNGSLRLVLFKVGNGPHVYQAVASTDTKTLAPDTGYEFKERIPVKQGYLLGLAPTHAYVGITPGSSDVLDEFPTDVPVGATATATATRTARLNVAATVETDKDGDGFGDVSQDRCPTQKATQDACSNKFNFGRLKHNRNKGTARFPVTVPGAGTLTLSGKGVVGQRLARRAATPVARSISAAGTVKLLIKAKGKAKRKLNSDGKVKIRVKVTYTPTDGKPSTKKPKVKLVKELQP